MSSLTYLSCRWCTSPCEPTRLLCPVCGSDKLDLLGSAGLGTVHRIIDYTYDFDQGSRIRQTCAVALDEGYTTIGVVTDSRLGSIAPGTRVRLRPDWHHQPEFQPC